MDLSDNSHILARLNHINMLIDKLVETEHGFVDPETGEIVKTAFTNTKQSFKKRVTYDNFVQLYVRDLADIYRINSRTQIALLIILCEESNLMITSSDSVTTFTALIDDKLRWAKKLEINPGKNIDNALAELVKKDIILRVSRGKYAINPKYVFAGALKDRPKYIELSVQYQIKEDNE